MWLFEQIRQNNNFYLYDKTSFPQICVVAQTF